MALVPVGRGSVWAVSQPRLLTNAGIAGDGLAIALPLAGAAGGGAVGIDAFHQGGSPTLGSLAYLPRWVQLDILEVAAIAILAAPWPRPAVSAPWRPRTPSPRRSTVELVRSLAAMHRSAGRLAAATGPLAHAYRARLGGLAELAEDALSSSSPPRPRGSPCEHASASRNSRGG